MTLSDKYYLAPWSRVTFASPPDASYFFGYYGHSPLSADGRRLLAHRTDFDGRPVTSADQAEVGYFDIRDGSWHTLGNTRAFNWQQGAMLQWLGSDFQSRVVYNDQEGDRFVARIVEVASGGRRTVPHAVYAVHPSGSMALGVRFERHYFVRAYHYEGVRDERWNVPLHPDDGILSVDLETGASRLVLRTADIAAYDPPQEASGVPHWLEHLLWNPSGTRFGLLHRFGTNTHYVTRVFTVDGDGGRIFGLPDYANHSYTHMGWRDDHTFVIFASKQKPLGKAYAKMAQSPSQLRALPVWLYRSVKRFLPRRFIARRYMESGYLVVCDGEGVQRSYSTGPLWADGHPSWTRDGRFMLTDTYADESGYRHLLLYDAKHDHVHTIGRFYSSYNESVYRCDLHPRFSKDDQSVIIDTANTCRRQIVVIQLELGRFGR